MNIGKAALGCFSILVLGVLGLAAIGASHNDDVDRVSASVRQPAAALRPAEMSPSAARRAGALVAAGDGSQWLAASDEERDLAIVLMATTWAEGRGWDRDELLRSSYHLKGCLNRFYEGGTMNSMMVSEIAATCETLRQQG